MALRIANRLAWKVGMLWLVATVTFIALHLAPGGPLTAMAGPGIATSKASLHALEVHYGLNKPVAVQYLDYLWGLLHGNLGESFSLQLPVSTVLASALPSTLQLTFTALIFAWLIALASVLATAGRSRAADSVGRGVEGGMTSLPDFWIGLELLTVFGFKLHWVPVAGGTSLLALIVPALALAIPLSGYIAQLTRQSFEDALDQPFAFSARARSMSDSGVRVRHALRHAVLPGISFTGVAVGWLVSGSVVVEQIFSRPGIGTVVLNAVSNRDYPVVLGVALVVAVTYAVVNLVVDILYPIIDPRIGAHA